MKIYKILILVIFSINSVIAQIDFKNSVKFNAVGPFTGLYSLQYERVISNHWSFNNTFFIRQKSLIPFGVAIDTLAKRRGVGLTGIKFQYIFMNEARLGIKGYAPEIRYYIGNKKNRFFVSAFGQFESFDMTVPAAIPAKFRGLFLDIKLPVDFTFQTLSGGLLIGKQFKWDRFGVDVVVFGPHFGKATKFNAIGKNEIISNLSEEEKTYVKDKIIERFGLSEKYFSLSITDQAAEIKSIKPVPYLGIRGFGVNLFYMF